MFVTIFRLPYYLFTFYLPKLDIMISLLFQLSQIFAFFDILLSCSVTVVFALSGVLFDRSHLFLCLQYVGEFGLLWAWGGAGYLFWFFSTFRLPFVKISVVVN